MLPDGLHPTTLEEMRAILGFTARRRQLIDGLEAYAQAWGNALEAMIVDGSFATRKPEPEDIDIILVPRPESLVSGAIVALARTLSFDRAHTKAEYGCEGFLVTGSVDLQGWLEFFKHDRLGNIRGLLLLRVPA